MYIGSSIATNVEGLLHRMGGSRQGIHAPEREPPTFWSLRCSKICEKPAARLLDARVFLHALDWVAVKELELNCHNMDV